MLLTHMDCMFETTLQPTTSSLKSNVIVAKASKSKHHKKGRHTTILPRVHT